MTIIILGTIPLETNSLKKKIICFKGYIMYNVPHLNIIPNFNNFFPKHIQNANILHEHVPNQISKLYSEFLEVILTLQLFQKHKIPLPIPPYLYIPYYKYLNVDWIFFFHSAYLQIWVQLTTIYRHFYKNISHQLSDNGAANWTYRNHYHYFHYIN